MPLNDPGVDAGLGARPGRSPSRRKTVDDLLDELTSWSPGERAGMFRQWLRVSLSLVHLHVLTVLEADGPLPMGKLAEALDVSVASAAFTVDRMEQRGLVERRRERDDRRIVLVHPTEAGGAVFRDLAQQRRKHLAALLDRMADTELEAFLTGLRAMRRVRAEGMADVSGHRTRGTGTS